MMVPPPAARQLPIESDRLAAFRDQRNKQRVRTLAKRVLSRDQEGVGQLSQVATRLRSAPFLAQATQLARLWAETRRWCRFANSGGLDDLKRIVPIQARYAAEYPDTSATSPPIATSPTEGKVHIQPVG